MGQPQKKSHLLRNVLAGLLIAFICICCVLPTSAYLYGRTITPSPSFTPSKTFTPSRTPTITSTPTATNTPGATEKAQAKADDATATALEVSFEQTQAKLDKTSAADAVQATKTFVADYGTIERRELVTYADNHTGEKVKIRGRIFNINSATEFQMYLQGSNDAVYIVLDDSMTGIYENDFVTVYGTVAGFFEGTNSFGGTIKQPMINSAVVTKP